ncbi:cell division protein FtsQ/DivIB [Streptococcus sp. CSL10205-OR2]|uniref:cell division protein FtsQ/DivIB n=1 Tax=Streptococcus sp. CSL10205-OR2 TaxID=2980558 RepID=UPI0021D8A72C|nr:FtsQ-type POTRA domain-containing protein [Streptococcus sp. CSL10205-OR2]MCU9533462.1 FtsQ-type POTRA domain-containing protein [Streptococcus sp. CSL10205-OR2]
MSNKQEPSKKEDVLTEWQKKNLEFQKRKQEKEKLEQEKQERELQKKKEEIEKAKLKRQQEKEQEQEEEQSQKVSDDKEVLSEENSSNEEVDEEEVAQKEETSIEEENSKEDVKVTLPVKKDNVQIKELEENRPNTLPKKPFVLDEKLKKALPILIGFSILLLFSIFMITPYSKDKQISVAGMTHTNEETVYAASGIKDSDYILSLITNKKQFEQAVVNGDPWVKSANISYQFPNQFRITVSEYRIVAYQQIEAGFQPILETGKIMPTITKAQMPEEFLLIELLQQEDVSLLVKELMTLDREIVDSMVSIRLANSTTTKDLLNIQMRDGNNVRVPLSQLEVKMPLYSEIAQQVPVGSIIDMEVGVYATSEQLEILSDQIKAENIAKKEEEKAAEEAKEAANNQSSEEAPVSEELAPTTEPTNSEVSE